MSSIYRVYYPKDPSFRFNPDLKTADIADPPGAIFPEGGWDCIGDVKADDLEDLYYLLNVVIDRKKFRSMSVGDVAYDILAGRFYQVDDFGFAEVPS